MKKQRSIKNSKTVYYNNTGFNLEIRESQIENSGLGLFLKNSAEMIPKDTFLGYYEGFWNYDLDTLSNYSYYINSRICLDVEKDRKPYTAIMNDAFRTGFKNNVVSEILIPETEINKIRKKNCHHYDPTRIVGLFTIDDIMPGDELFFEYGESYWKSW
jgi:SET domain-containing protein